jgi:hypothetical protein
MEGGRRRWCGGLIVGVLVAGPACLPETGEQAVPSAQRQGRGDPRPREPQAEAGAARGAAKPVHEGASRSRGAAKPVQEPPRSQAAAGATGRTAQALLAALPVRPHASRSGYARDQFGPAWADVDKNGCDTRDDILRRDLTKVRIEQGSRDCVVASGRLADPYTGKNIVFERGRGATVDIDHVVALSDAWVTGAATWAPERRLALANDPLNLLAVDASANRAKGSHNAAGWLPPNKRYHCAYVARQIAVKAKYGLWVTADEHRAMTQVLSRCPDEPAPTDEAPKQAPSRSSTTRRDDPPPASDRKQSAPSKPTTKPTRTPDPNYGSCKNAKAHGAGPYRRGVDPEYHYYRDGDGDGIVCE